MKTALVVGGGPAGLSAAEVLVEGGWAVTVAEALPSPARKLLRAGVGGLNLTHSQPFEAFLDAYGPSRPVLDPFLRRFGPMELQAWAGALGIPLFTDSSGRVFPEGMGAGSLVDAWLARLTRQGVTLLPRTTWTGWGPGLEVDALVLALGGPTWPQLGTGGAWVPLLEERGVALSPWKPANVGYEVAWSAVFREKFAGQPLKDTVLAEVGGRPFGRKGELMITPWGLEGGLLYAAGSRLREGASTGGTPLVLDLVPGRPLERVLAELSRPRDGRSLSTHLAKTIQLSPTKIGLLREALGPGPAPDASRIAGLLKALPLHLVGPRPLGEAISAAGGVRWDELTPGLELRRVPGVWCAGEMIDWEAPTGGYLLTACFSLGRAAGESVLKAGTLRTPGGVTLSN